MNDLFEQFLARLKEIAPEGLPLSDRQLMLCYNKSNGYIHAWYLIKVVGFLQQELEKFLYTKNPAIMFRTAPLVFATNLEDGGQ